MLMNNIGEHIHELVIDTGIIPILVKIVKKKVSFLHEVFCYLALSFFLNLTFLFCFALWLQSDLAVRERIFLLLDATQTSLGGASGKFPQYYNAYYELVVGTNLRTKPEDILMF